MDDGVKAEVVLVIRKRVKFVVSASTSLVGKRVKFVVSATYFT